MIREYVVKVTDALVPDAFQRFESEWAPEQELIRCKDCKYCEYPKAEKEWCKKGHLHGNAQTWFCADGERQVK